MGLGTISLCFPFLFSAFVLLSSYLRNAVAEELLPSNRKALEVIMGGGGGGNSGYARAPSPECDCQEPPPSPPPPQPSCPPPPSPPPPACPPPTSPPPPPPKPPTVNRVERARQVLLKFKLNINDPKGYTRNWNETNDPCHFNGIRCAEYPNSKQQAVAGIDLNGAGISGKGKDLTLSGILGNIPDLTFFHVNSNNFSGAIPNEIVKYLYFFELDLSNNKMVGQFPKEVLQSKRLVFLDLRFNQLQGPVPPELFQLELDVIFINNNQFSQNLPDNFGSTPARFLTFANNKLTGPIPRSIGKASKTLTEVLFLGNYFSGCLPYEIGYLKEARVFDVSRNWLTGPIPHSFACLENIQFLNLTDNQFYGTIPEMVCQLPKLRNNGNLSLSDNYFTQVGPECRKLIMSNVLDVKKNCILGLPNQRPQAQCTDFFSKVKPCPDQKALNLIPCKKYYSSSQRTTLDPETSASPPAPVTYKSLNPHRS